MYPGIAISICHSVNKHALLNLPSTQIQVHINWPEIQISTNNHVPLFVMKGAFKCENGELDVKYHIQHDFFQAFLLLLTDREWIEKQRASN